MPQKITSTGKQAEATKCVLESVRIRLVENGLSAYIFASLPSQRPAQGPVSLKEDRFATYLSVSQRFEGRGQQSVARILAAGPFRARQKS
jgi:hypothetical protein